MSQTENLDEASEKIKLLSKQVSVLEQRLAFYEQHGPAKLYYALNRKASEMADLLNKTNLKDVPLDDPKDKTFDRLKVIWNDSSSLSIAIKELGQTAGISGDEESDTKNKISAKLTTPESIANVLGNTTGKND